MDPIDSWVDAVALRKLAESLVAPSLQAEETPEESYGPAFVGFDRPAVTPSVAAATPPPASRGGSRLGEAPVAREAPVRQTPPAVQVEEHARATLAGARQLADRGGILTPRPPAPVAAAPSSAPAPVAAAPPAPRLEPTPPARPQAPPLQALPLSSPRGLFLERLHAYGDWLHRAVGAKAFFVADREGELLIDEVQSTKLLQVARTLAQASWSASRKAGGEPQVGSLHVKLGADSILEVLPVSTHYGPLILGVVVPSLLPTATVQVVATSLQKAVNTPIQASREP